MLKYEKAYRQGEVLFFKVKKPKVRYRQSRVVANGVIREGEKEGHEHKVEGGESTLSLFDDTGNGTLEIKKSATVTHPEHDDIKLPPGDYEVRIQKEATGPNSSQSVKD